jgi:hypothetical protein
MNGFIKKDTKNYFFNLDCYIRELNIGIEFNGDMWHANPNKYKASDVFHHPLKRILLPKKYGIRIK